MISSIGLAQQDILFPFTKVTDISIPVLPVAAPYVVHIQGNFAYQCCFSNPGYLVIYDIGRKKYPQIKGYVQTDIGSYSNIVDGNYCYVCTSASKLDVINISNPSSPSVIGVVTAVGAGALYGLDKKGNYVYLSSQNSGLIVVDVSIPTSPSIVFTQTNKKSVGVSISGNIALMTNYTTSNPTTIRDVVAWDISTPTSPTLIPGTTLVLPTNAKPGPIKWDGLNNLIYVGERNTPPLSPVIYILDSAPLFNLTPSAPTILGTIPTGGYIHLTDIVSPINSNFVYTYSGSSGITYYLQAWDITNKAAPSLVNTISGSGSFLGGTDWRNFIFVNDTTNRKLCTYTKI